MTLNTEEARLYVELGLIHIKQKRPEAALDDFTQAIAAQPEAPQAYQHRGMLHLLQQQYAEARADFETVLEMHPDNATAHFGLGNVLFKTADYAGALEHLERAQALGHPQAGQYVERARAELQQATASPAPDSTAPAPEPEPEPEDSETLNNQGLQQLAQHHYVEALTLFRQAIALDPQYAKAHFNAASILNGQGELTEALNHLKHAVQLGYEPAKPLAAEVYRKLKQQDAPPADTPSGDQGVIPPAELLKVAGQVLTKFARHHCGADRETIQRTEKGVFGMGERQITTHEVRWAVSMEERYVLQPDGARESVQGVELDLQQTPRAVIRVAAHDAHNYQVQIMAEEPLPKTKRRALLGKVTDIIPATPQQLLALLNNFVAQGILVKEESYLRYIPQDAATP